MTDFLFSMPSFLEGAARTLDLGATFDQFNAHPSPAVSDGRALAEDWKAVGRDLEAALAEFEAQTRDAP
ncbi:MAG: hypothetical protein AB1578_20925 [Thermodesulfobacteriota bacterium]